MTIGHTVRRSDTDLPHFAQDMSESRAPSPPHSSSAPSTASAEHVVRFFQSSQEQVFRQSSSCGKHLSLSGDVSFRGSHREIHVFAIDNRRRRGSGGRGQRGEGGQGGGEKRRVGFFAFSLFNCLFAEKRRLLFWRRLCPKHKKRPKWRSMTS